MYEKNFIQMKLYYFNPHDYGKQAFVMAESPEKAKEYLLNKKLPIKMVKASWPEKEDFDLNDYHNREIDNMIRLKEKYTLEEFNVGEVIFSEIC